MKRLFPFGFVIIFFAVVSIACGTSTGSDPSLDQTQVALAVQQTDLAQGQNPLAQPPAGEQDAAPPTYTPYPTYTQQAPQQPEQPQSVPATATMTLTSTHTPTITQTATQEVLFLNVTVDRLEFHCVPGDGPTTLTITVEMSDVDRGAALFWRLHEKANDNKLAWEVVDMQRAGGNERTYTFDADTWNGTNNFFYPPMMGESWFEFQIISNDGLERTEVFADVTFFPCAC